MPQITSNTQIDTINILQESLTTNDSDLLFIQRDATSYKLKKENLIIPRQQIAPISSLKVLGNISVSSAAPSEITVDTDLSTVSGSHDTLASAKAIKDYIAGVADNLTIKTAWGRGFDDAIVDVSVGDVTNGDYYGDNGMTEILSVIVSLRETIQINDTDFSGFRAYPITPVSGTTFTIKAEGGAYNSTKQAWGQWLVIGV